MATTILDELYQLTGSSGGAHPKILAAYNSDTEHLMAKEKKLKVDYEHLIIKFPSSFDAPDIANIEYTYYKMAIDAGIEISVSKLFKGRSGQAYFGTKRFDRIGNYRLYMQAASGIMHNNFRLSSLDYGNLMDSAFKLEKDVRAYEKILRLAAFNVFGHIRDDHSKNFAFLMNSNGNWKLAPAYDLTFSSSGHGLHSTMVANESAKSTKKQLMELADYFKIKNANETIDQVRNMVSNWKMYADQCEVSNASKNNIHKIINA